MADKKKFVNTDHLDVEREKDFAQANAKLPWWFIVIFGYLAFFAFQYTSNNGGKFNYQVYEKFQTLAQVEASQPIGNADPMVLLGKEKYGLCATCHQANGAGVANLAPPLAGSEWVNETGPERIIRIVLNGLQGPISVKGENWNLAMAPLGSTLNDQEIAAILTYVRSSWGNTGSPVSPEQVAAIRAEVGNHSMWKSEELLQVPVSTPN